MARIVSGTVGGRRIATPAGDATRPTSDYVREALYSRLEHLDAVHGARVLDLYAGSGALGLEARSRGAREVVLVEANRGTADVARANIRALGLDAVHVHTDTVERFLLGEGAHEPFELVFLDPPYDLAEDRLGDVLALLAAHGWLAADSLVVVERSARSPEPRWPAALSAAGERRYGDTRVWFADAPGDDEVA